MGQLVVWTVAALTCIVRAQLVELSDAALTADTPIPTCDAITDVQIGGSDWTNVVQTTCKLWPPQFGKFPVNTTTQLTGLLDQLVSSEIWKRTRDLFKRHNDDYCLRREENRLVMTTVADDYECPETLNEDVLEEDPELQDPHVNTSLQDLTSGNWACMREANPNDESFPCKCSRRDVMLQGRYQNNSLPVLSIASRPRNCKMVHRGVCYGDCPPKFRPTWLKGWFRPVCTLVCADSNHPTTCGTGCASSRRACIGVILTMVKEVTLAASKVAGFIIGGAAGLAVAQTVAYVIKIAEFGLNILVRLLDVIDVTWKTFSREDAELATFVSIFQVLKEEAASFVSDWAKLELAMQNAGSMILSLLDASFGWNHINLGWITNAIVQYGGDALQGAFQVASSFAYAKCEPATDEVHFVVENIGDQRLVGTWTNDGKQNGKPRYRKIADRSNTLMEWSSRHKTWSFWYKDTSFGRGWWFGWLGFGWRELYYSKSPTTTFPKSGWQKDEGALPLPALVDAQNGGV